MSTRTRMFGVLATTMIVVAACSPGGGTTPAPSVSAPSAAASAAESTAPSEPASAAAGPVEFDWWHITTADVGKADFQAIADAYMAAHPNVKINLTVLENEAFKAKLTTQIQSGDVPDLFQSWGGGGMADQANAGLLKDITADVADWASTINPGAMSIYQYNGKQYGIPWDMGMIGFWYNKALFEQAGITAPPTSWDEYLAAVKKLKDAGITPLAIAGKDQWPSMHLWTYLVLRYGGAEALQEMVQTGNWNTDACTKAGEAVVALNALDPYQKGYRAATYPQEAAEVGNGKAAMELMGQWAPAVQADSSTDKKGLGEDLGWFAFPAVTGGAGAPTDGVGGGNGIAVGKDAPPEAIDFLKFFNSVDNQSKLNTDGVGLSTTVGTESTISDPNLQAVLAGRGNAQFIQLYLDQATSADLGKVFNEATMALFAGQSDPATVCQTISDAAATQ